MYRRQQLVTFSLQLLLTLFGFQSLVNDLLKLKRHHDAEAIVVGYKSGTGKYSGMMGSLLVHTEEGIQFYIGTGFTDEMRLDPPPIGSRITFRYNGYTQNGKPKFARFIREKAEY